MLEILILFIRACLFYAVPAVIGWTVMHSAGIFFWPVWTKFNSFLKLGLSFSTGILIIMSSALLINLTSEHFITIFFPLIYLWFFAGAMVLAWKIIKKELLVRKKDFLTGVIIFLLSLIAFGIWRIDAPFPMNWDLYEHQTLSTAINDGQFDFQTSQISDTFGFNSYPPTFHTLMAISQFGMDLSPTNILNYWSMVSFVHLLSVGLASYALAWAITKHKLTSLLSATIGVLTFESVVAFTSLFILPQTVAATLFALSWAGMIAQLNQLKQQIGWIVLAIISLSLLSLHYVIGSIAVLTLLASYTLLKFNLLEEKFSKDVLTLVVALTITSIAASFVLDLGSINQGEAELYTFGLSEKLTFNLNIYGLGMIIFGGWGVWQLWKNKASVNYQLVLLILIAFIGLLLSNFPYVLKFFTLARFFIHLAMAMSLAILIGWCGKLRLYAYILVVFSLLIILALNVAEWKNHLFFAGQYTQVADNDIKAAHFLRSEFGHTNTLIISDPSTMYLMEGLSGVNSAGGAFANKENRQLIDEGLTNNIVQLEKVKDKLQEKPANKILIISARTLRWLEASEKNKLSFEFNVWRPENFTAEDVSFLRSDKFSNFNLIYQNGSYYMILL